MGEALAYELSRVAYLLGIGVGVALLMAGVIFLLVGLNLIIKDDPEYIGRVPYPRRVDRDDEDS